MATLYRCPMPGDRLCACGRVARELRRQGIEFDEVRVSWLRRGRDEVQELSGQRVVPLLVTDEATICDSRRIVEHLRRIAAEQAAPSEPEPDAASPTEPVLEELVLQEFPPLHAVAEEPPTEEEPGPVVPVAAGQLSIEFFGPPATGQPGTGAAAPLWEGEAAGAAEPVGEGEATGAAQPLPERDSNAVAAEPSSASGAAPALEQEPVVLRVLRYGSPPPGRQAAKPPGDEAPGLPGAGEQAVDGGEAGPPRPAP